MVTPAAWSFCTHCWMRACEAVGRVNPHSSLAAIRLLSGTTLTSRRIPRCCKLRCRAITASALAWALSAACRSSLSSSLRNSHCVQPGRTRGPVSPSSSQLPARSRSAASLGSGALASSLAMRWVISPCSTWPLDRCLSGISSSLPLATSQPHDSRPAPRNSARVTPAIGLVRRASALGGVGAVLGGGVFIVIRTGSTGRGPNHGWRSTRTTARSRPRATGQRHARTTRGWRSGARRVPARSAG